MDNPLRDLILSYHSGESLRSASPYIVVWSAIFLDTDLGKISSSQEVSQWIRMVVHSQGQAVLKKRPQDVPEVEIAWLQQKSLNEPIRLLPHRGAQVARKPCLVFRAGRQKIP